MNTVADVDKAVLIFVRLGSSCRQLTVRSRRIRYTFNENDTVPCAIAVKAMFIYLLPSFLKVYRVSSTDVLKLLDWCKNCFKSNYRK